MGEKRVNHGLGQGKILFFFFFFFWHLVKLASKQVS